MLKRPNLHDLPLAIHTPDRLRLAYTGTGSGELTVLYLHGLLADSSFWAPLIEHLTPHVADRARQFAYDARGHGRSDWPRPTATTDFGVLADDLALVIDTISGPVVLVAHSIGGYVVLEYARRHRSQLADRVGEVVMFAVAGEEPDWPALRTFRPAARSLRWMRHRGPLDVINAAGHSYLESKLRSLAAHAKPGRAQLIPSIHPVDPRATADICTNVTVFEVDDDIARSLSAVPVSICTAEFDKVVPPAQSRRVAHRIPGAYLHHIPGAGHSLPLVDPASAAAPIICAVDRLTGGATQTHPAPVLARSMRDSR
ncbi:alpha/beta fold hydrolase (plasmid) [Nocardia sp. CA-084685]|uniref:alpha/beta fold hydrolase n=1 Tax=Nocardia sp. CA-084685 TaxID=3239970 RepID=UPI003D956F5A